MSAAGSDVPNITGIEYQGPRIDFCCNILNILQQKSICAT